jgi:hypothetical protein
MFTSLMALRAIVLRLLLGTITTWALSCTPRSSVIFTVPKAPIFYMNPAKSVLSARGSNK